jgi:hypothetical protein
LVKIGGDEMRQLKFRIWDKKYNAFRYWGFIDPNKSIFAGIPSGAGIDIEYCRSNSEVRRWKIQRIVR